MDDFGNQIRRLYEKQIFENVENETPHNPYDQEVRELTAIENGDLEAFEKSIAEVFPGEYGQLHDDPIRNAKDMMIVVLATSSRAAIRGGVPAERAFSMSDQFIRQIEALSDIPTIQVTCRQMQREFILAVLEHTQAKKSSDTGESRLSQILKTQENEHVTAAKNYIYAHLHGKVSLAEIADALHVNASYLSRLFKKSTGMTISRYILSAKIALVQNLLKYSQYTNSEIASYLGFSSQSHLGKCFREETGLTLRAYRMRYQVQDFQG